MGATLWARVLAAVRNLRTAVFAWIGVAMVWPLSPGIGNLYHWQQEPDSKRQIFFLSVCILFTVYAAIYRAAAPLRSALPTAVLLASVLCLAFSASYAFTITDWTTSQKLIIATIKTATAAVVLLTFLTFGATHLFERAIWGILLVLEAYSQIQYPACWAGRTFFDDGESKTSCGRFIGGLLQHIGLPPGIGDFLAYAEYPVAVLLTVWVVWRWWYVGRPEAPS